MVGQASKSLPMSGFIQTLDNPIDTTYLNYYYYYYNYRPAQLRWYEVAVRRKLGWTLVHLADQPFTAWFGRVAELFEHGVDPGQQRAIERIVVGQQVRAGRYGVEHLEVFGLIPGVVVARLQLGAGHSIWAVLHRIPARKNSRYVRLKMLPVDS